MNLLSTSKSAEMVEYQKSLTAPAGGSSTLSVSPSGNLESALSFCQRQIAELEGREVVDPDDCGLVVAELMRLSGEMLESACNRDQGAMELYADANEAMERIALLLEGSEARSNSK